MGSVTSRGLWEVLHRGLWEVLHRVGGLKQTKSTESSPLDSGLA